MWSGNVIFREEHGETEISGNMPSDVIFPFSCIWYLKSYLLRSVVNNRFVTSIVSGWLSINLNATG